MRSDTFEPNRPYLLDRGAHWRQLANRIQLNDARAWRSQISVELALCVKCRVRTSSVTVVAWSVRASVYLSADYDRELCQNG